MCEIGLAYETGENFMKEVIFNLVLKKIYNCECFYHSDTLGETDDVLLLWIKKFPVGMEESIYFFCASKDKIYSATRNEKLCV